MTNQSQAGPDLLDYVDQIEEAPFQFAMILRMLRGRWHWVILLVLLLGGSGLFVGYNFQPDQYSGISIIELKPAYSVAIEVQDIEQHQPYWNFVGGEVRTLQSREVIENAMAQPEWQKAIAQRPSTLPEVTVDFFAENLEVIPPGRYETVLTVQYTDEHPETARAGINSILESYRQEHKLAKTQQIDENLRLLQEQLASLEQSKAATESQVKLFITGEEMVTIDSRLKSKLREKDNMEFRLIEIDLSLKPYLDNLESSDPDGKPILQDPEMAALFDEQRRLEETYTYLTEVLGRGEEMLDVVQVRRSLTMVKHKIVKLEQQRLAQADPNNEQSVVPPKVAELMAKREVIVQKIEQLSAETADLASRLSAVEDYNVKLLDIREDIRVTRDKVNQYRETLGLRQNDDVSRIVIGKDAQTPIAPSNTDKRIKFAVVGALAGTVLGFSTVMLVGLFDRRIRHASDTIEGMPEANVLGVLPTLPPNLSDPEDAEAVAHSVHHIRTLLQIGGNRVFSITSPSAGSGKSSLATALGMSFAASGVRTLVMDCDLIGAGLSRRMGTVVHEPLETVIRRNDMVDEATLAGALTHVAAHDQPLDQVLLEQGLIDQDHMDAAIRLQRDTSLGLLDACESSRLRDCVASTDVDGLFILPIGRSRPGDASRLSPAAVRNLISQAREDYDIVLIDTGPALGSIEASIVSAEADGTVVIVSRGDHKRVAQRMIDQLRSVRANIVGFVFNHALHRDIHHASYASMVSQERRSDIKSKSSVKTLDQNRSARLGPLGIAVATYSEDEIYDMNGSHAAMNSSGSSAVKS